MCVCVCGSIMECYNLFLVINIAPRWQLHHDRSLLHPEEGIHGQKWSRQESCSLLHFEMFWDVLFDIHKQYQLSCNGNCNGHLNSLKNMPPNIISRLGKVLKLKDYIDIGGITHKTQQTWTLNMLAVSRTWHHSTLTIGWVTILLNLFCNLFQTLQLEW